MTKQKLTLGDFRRDPALSRHSARSKAVARALDAGSAKLPHSMVLTSIEFAEFLSQLTPKRFELLRLASRKMRSIADLAEAAHRDPAAVSRDIAKLSRLGLVKVETVPNDGHGQKKMVTAVTAISITAEIA